LRCSTSFAGHGAQRAAREDGQVGLVEVRILTVASGDTGQAISGIYVQLGDRDDSVVEQLDLKVVQVALTVFGDIHPADHGAVGQLLPADRATGGRVEVIKENGNTRQIEMVGNTLAGIGVPRGESDEPVAADEEAGVSDSVERDCRSAGESDLLRVIIGENDLRSSGGIGREAGDLSRTAAIKICRSVGCEGGGSQIHVVVT